MLSRVLPGVSVTMTVVYRYLPNKPYETTATCGCKVRRRRLLPRKTRRLCRKLGKPKVDNIRCCRCRDRFRDCLVVCGAKRRRSASQHETRRNAWLSSLYRVVVVAVTTAAYAVFAPKTDRATARSAHRGPASSETQPRGRSGKQPFNSHRGQNQHLYYRRFFRSAAFPATTCRSRCAGKPTRRGQHRVATSGHTTNDVK